MKNTKSQNVKQLECCCCGGLAIGRQWHNRDKGFGLCADCAQWISKRETPEEMQCSYGTPGVHHSLEG